MLSTFIIFCLITVSFADKQDSSKCAVPRRGGQVDLYRYAGEWRDYQQSHNNIFHYGKCPISYWDKPIKGISKVVVTAFSTIKEDYNTTIIAEAFNNGHNLGMNFELPVLGNLYREYYVIATDYDNYSIAWNCINENNTSVVYANVFTRDKVPKVDIEKIKRRVFAEAGLEVPHMDQVDHRDCP